jgi:hypothetical protein
MYNILGPGLGANGRRQKRKAQTQKTQKFLQTQYAKRKRKPKNNAKDAKRKIYLPIKSAVKIEKNIQNCRQFLIINYAFS